jgi:aminoglycoside 6'-N-acetyltransferase
MDEPTLCLQGPRVTLRPVTGSDIERLILILCEPGVSRYWSEPDDEFDRRELLAGDDVGERVTTFVIVLNRETIGWISGWEKLHRDYRHAGLDLFVSSAYQGKGYGTEAIRLVCRFLFDVRGHHRVTVDPAVDNAAAIRAYERVGFRRVGIMRRYERGADGGYHDGMLLELLSEDFRGDS